MKDRVGQLNEMTDKITEARPLPPASASSRLFLQRHFKMYLSSFALDSSCANLMIQQKLAAKTENWNLHRNTNLFYDLKILAISMDLVQADRKF